MRAAALALGLLLAASLGPAARAAAMERPRERSLANGLRVVVFPRTGLPIVQIQLVVSAGSRAEAAGQAGLASLTAQMLRQGTTSRSAEDFATELDTLGATLSVSVGRDAAQMAAGCRAAEFESVLELVSDAVVNPLFAEEAFQTVRRQVAGQLGVQAQNPATLADERANALAFGTHPYGHSVRGSLTWLLAASRDQVRAFHRDHWRPDRAVLAIAGDVDAERAFAAAAEWFGRWGGKSVAEAAAGPPSARRGVFVSDLPGSSVTEVRAVLLAPGRGDPAYPGWAVLRELLEGGGLPPGVHASLSPGREASVLVVSATARPESAAVAAERVRGSLRALATAPAPGAVEAARKRAAQAQAFTTETLGGLLSSWLAGDAAGLGADQLGSAPATLRAASPPALTGDATLLLAGPLERMKAGLARLGRVDTLGGEEEVAGVRAVAATPEQRRRGRRLVEQAVVAHGGAARLKAVTMSELDGELRMVIAGRDLTGESRVMRLDPSRLVNTTRFLDFEHRQVLDGSRGWSLSTAGDSASLVPADTTSLVSLRAILHSDLIHLLRAASEPASDPVDVGRAEQDHQPCDRVEFMSPTGGRTRLWLDATSHRVVAVDAQPTPQGTWRDRRRWSDFFLVQGVWWPRQEVREVDGEKVSTTTLRRVAVNAAVDSTLFRRPIVARGQIRGLE